MSKHIHKYRRINIGTGGKVYLVMKCIKPHCTSYTPMRSKLSCPLLKGSIAECGRCGQEFILDKRALRMAEPCCESCVKGRKDLKPELDFWEGLEKGLSK